MYTHRDVYTHHASTSRCIIHQKRPIYTQKRPYNTDILISDLCTLKRDTLTDHGSTSRCTISIKKDPYTLKRDQNTQNRDLCYTQKRPMHTQKRPMHTQKRPMHTQKRRTHRSWKHLKIHHWHDCPRRICGMEL